MKLVFNPYSGEFQYVDSDDSFKFGTVQTDEGTYPVAESASDILTFQSSDESVLITGDETTDTIDFKTQKLWSDNKVIQRKIVPLTRVFLETNGTTITHNIVGLDTLVSAVGVFNAGGDRFSLPHILPNGILITFKIDGTDITSIVDGAPQFELFTNAHLVLEFTTI